MNVVLEINILNLPEDSHWVVDVVSPLRTNIMKTFSHRNLLLKKTILTIAYQEHDLFLKILLEFFHNTNE